MKLIKYMMVKDFIHIIHENKEIIISTENTSFFNFSPNQIFNYFLERI